MPLPPSRAAVLIAALPSLLLAAPAVSGAAQPDLMAAAVQRGPSSAAVGGSFSVRAEIRNVAAGRSGASTTRFYLSPDRARSFKERAASRTDPRSSSIDVLLGGERRERGLGRRATSRSTTRVTVPETLAAGRYTLLACADDRGEVRELDEVRQCAAAPGRISITAPAGAAGAFTSVNADLPDVTDGAVDARAEFLRAMACTPPVKGRAVRSAPAALKRIAAQIRFKVGPGAWDGFRASPEVATATAAQFSALGQLADGNLGAALAAATRAAELAPRDADALRNAAALAVSAGMPSEALALVDASAKARQSSPVPGGVDRRAVAQQIRGMALLQLGQTKRGVRALQSAAALDPALEMEAASGEAAAALCSGGVAAARPKLKRSSQRRRPGTPPAPTDTAHGRASTLRPLVFPETPAEAVRLQGYFEERAERIGGELEELNARIDETNEAMHARALSPVQGRRERWLMRRIATLIDRPDLAAQQRALIEDDQRMEIYQRFWGFSSEAAGPAAFATFSSAATTACATTTGSKWACYEAKMRSTCTPALRTHHQEWVREEIRVRRAREQWLATLSREMTALAANLEDPLAREHVRLQVALLEASLADGERDAANWGRVLAGHETLCVKNPDGATPEAGGGAGSGDPQIDGGSACNGLSSSMSFVFDPVKLVDGVPGAKELPRLPKIKASCERIQVSYEFGKSGWAQPFVQIDWKFRAGSVSAFAGVRAKVEMTGHTESLKTGFYLTASGQGVEDFGYRVSAGTSTMVSPVIEAATKHDFDLSFVPAFKDAGALLGS